MGLNREVIDAHWARSLEEDVFPRTIKPINVKPIWKSVEESVQDMDAWIVRQRELRARKCTRPEGEYYPYKLGLIVSAY